jgi:two-component system NarL family sensor kinase
VALSWHLKKNTDARFNPGLEKLFLPSIDTRCHSSQHLKLNILITFDKNNIVFLLVVVTAVILLLAVCVVTLVYLYKKIKSLHLKKINTLRLNHEKNLMAAQLEVQESTFQHISREIHDNISLALSISKLQLNTVNMLDERDAEKKITTSIDLISKSIHDLLNLSRSLNTDLIKSLGLINAIEKEVEQVHLSGLFKIETEITGEPVFMEPESELLIFRIVQESLNNIIRHSEAKIIKITLRYYDSYVDLIIKDDGKGFDYLSPHDLPKGAGLNNIKARTRILNGEASIFSAPGEGTCIHLSIPYNS